MSLVRTLVVIGFVPLLSSGYGGPNKVSLCQILPDSSTLTEYCSLELGTATFSDVASTFRLMPKFDSTHQSFVVLQTPRVQLSFGGGYNAMRDEADLIRADGHVRSVLMRRYFTTTAEAAEFSGAMRRRIESAFTCAKETQAGGSNAMLCSDQSSSGTVIRYLWTNWADEPGTVAPFEVTISARLL